MKEIIWKRNLQGGENAYVGTIRIGQYHYNGVDSKNGTYKVSSMLPQSMLSNAKVFEVAEAKELVINEWNKFVENISIKKEG